VLVSDLGQMIRCPVHDIRIASRGTVGVVIFRTAEGERVVSVATLRDTGESDEAGDDEDETPPDGPDVGGVPPGDTVH
jgi:DNA gyrase subunit A